MRGQPVSEARPRPGVCGFAGEIWTLPRVAQVIEQEYGVSYHPTQVGRILKDCGWSWQQPTLRATQRSEGAIRNWREQRFPELKKGRSRRQDHPVGRRSGVLPRIKCGAGSAAPVAAHLGAGGADPSHPAPVEPGASERHQPDWGALPGGAGPLVQGAGVIWFLEQLLAKIPGQLLVIWDGAPIHRSRAVKEWLAQGAASRLRLEQLLGLPRS